MESDSPAVGAPGAAGTEIELFARAPRLHGTLSVDDRVRREVARDAGGLVSRQPAAVLRPRSIEDVTQMVRFCRQHRIRVVGRGQAHTTLGQAQAQGGLLVDLTSLDQIHSVSDDRAVVDAGVTWRRLLEETTARGLTPPVLTGFQGLSVGGTLSVGGLSGVAYDKGAQVDQVIELEVVTGEGRAVTCSPAQNACLFDAVLAGLGRCALIVRATVRLVAAPERVRHSVLCFSALSPFLCAMRELATRRSVDGLSGTIYLAANGPPRYELNALTFLFKSGASKTSTPIEDARSDATLTVTEHDYVDYYLQVDRLIDSLRSTGGWEGVMHPWFDVFLPDCHVERYVADVLSGLDPVHDVGPASLGALGQIHLFPVWSRTLGRPLLRVPEGDLIFLFDILTAAHSKGADPAYGRRMLDRNRRLFELARSLGGTRYSISAIPFSPTDWVEQLGAAHAELALQKRTHDPDGIMGGDIEEPNGVPLHNTVAQREQDR
jgi:FAD/FMN-containing dehydrogenase